MTSEELKKLNFIPTKEYTMWTIKDYHEEMCCDLKKITKRFCVPLDNVTAEILEKSFPWAVLYEPCVLVNKSNKNQAYWVFQDKNSILNEIKWYLNGDEIPETEARKFFDSDEEFEKNAHKKKKTDQCCCVKAENIATFVGGT